MINEDIRSIVESELRSDEKLLWADKPHKFPLSFMAVYLTGFSIVWTLMAISFAGVGVFASLFGATTSDSTAEVAGIGAFGAVFSIVSLLFVAIGIGMVLLGLKMLIGPSKEVYALTNQRGIIISPFFKYRIASLSRDVLENSERKGAPDLGTLTFTAKGGGIMGMWMNPYQTELNSFRKIQNPKQIEDLIHRTFKDKPHE